MSPSEELRMKEARRKQRGEGWSFPAMGAQAPKRFLARHAEKEEWNQYWFSQGTIQALVEVRREGVPVE